MKALIVDDEYLPAEYLLALIEKYCPEIHSCEIITDSEQALNHLKQNPVDLLFLDVEMPGQDGFALLLSLPESRIPSVIFTSAYKQYALQAFEVDAVHYLLKPVDSDQLIAAVNRVYREKNEINSKLMTALKAIQKNDPERSFISLPDGTSYNVVSQNEIIRVEGKGSYSTFFLTDGRSMLVSKRIRIYADQLDPELFIRPHQSHLVNLSQVRQFNKSNGGFLELKDGSIIPVSNGLRNKIKARIGL